MSKAEALRLAEEAQGVAAESYEAAKAVVWAVEKFEEAQPPVPWHVVLIGDTRAEAREFLRRHGFDSGPHKLVLMGPPTNSPWSTDEEDGDELWDGLKQWVANAPKERVHWPHRTAGRENGDRMLPRDLPDSVPQDEQGRARAWTPELLTAVFDSFRDGRYLHTWVRDFEDYHHRTEPPQSWAPVNSADFDQWDSRLRAFLDEIPDSLHPTFVGYQARPLLQGEAGTEAYWEAQLARQTLNVFADVGEAYWLETDHYWPQHANWAPNGQEADCIHGWGYDIAVSAGAQTDVLDPRVRRILVANLNPEDWERYGQDPLNVIPNWRRMVHLAKACEAIKGVAVYLRGRADQLDAERWRVLGECLRIATS